MPRKNHMQAEETGGHDDDIRSQKWQKMGTRTASSRAIEYFDELTKKVSGDRSWEEIIRVLWLSSTLFFIVGGYWLLRSLKDPIMSAVTGVEFIPRAKIASLFVVFGLVIVYNKLLDMFPKHHLFYMMGAAYGVLFSVVGFLLMHPTIGLANTNASSYRLLGWISYVAIESFGSMVVQCYWALVNSSVDVDFAKRNFGLIVAGAQVGSILGPTVATQANYIGIPALYLGGAFIMFLMIGAMYIYIERYGAPAADEEDDGDSSSSLTSGVKKPSSGKEEGIMEGFYLLYEHDYVKGIFCISSLFMVQVTVIDYMMKLLALERYQSFHPDDHQLAMKDFASFMGYFGQTTNSISFLFSLLGTGFVIKRFGLTITLLLFPVLLLICTVIVWLFPNIWVVFAVMMVIKGMSYALNNPTKEILYQTTSTSIKFKCKSWIDTFGQRSAKATGSLITDTFANSLVDLNNYGSFVGIVISTFLLWVSKYMGDQFEDLSSKGEKVGEAEKSISLEMAKCQNEDPDTSCGVVEEGQAIEVTPLVLTDIENEEVKVDDRFEESGRPRVSTLGTSTSRTRETVVFLGKRDKGSSEASSP